MMPLFFFTGATAAHPYSLTVGGLDVIKEPVSARYGVPTDSITVTEAGSGGVSSMSFTIDDPSLLVSMIGDEEVVLYDHTRGAPMFGGYIDSWTVRPDFGQQGRSYDVQCSGYETLLDTIAMPAMSINFATAAREDAPGSAFQETEFIQLLCGQTPLNHAAMPLPANEIPTQTYPVQRGRWAVVPYDTTVDFSGMSVRAAWEAFLAVCQSTGGNEAITTLSYNSSADVPPGRINDMWLTVDFYKGVRFAWNAPADTGSPVQKWWTDYTTLTLTDTPTGTPAENLTYSEDHSPSAIVNAVYVNGGNAAGRGSVGSGLTPRREVTISDSRILTTQAKVGAGTAVIASKSTPAGRGSFDLTSYTPVATIHPGSPLKITDARLTGMAGIFAPAPGVSFMITEIRKTLNSGTTQNWTVNYQTTVSPSTGLALVGGASSGAPSAMETIKAGV